MTEPLFTHFLIMRLANSSDSGANKLEPKIRLCIPAPGHSVASVPAAVHQFAFPDLNSLRHTNRMVSEAFKGNIGRNCFLFFRRHLYSQHSKKQSGASTEVKYLECLCLISKLDLHEIFDFVMQQVQIRWLLCPNSVPPFLLSLLKQVPEIPPPSGHIALALRPSTEEQGSNENFLLHRPHFEHMGVPADVLFEYLSIDNLMAVMSALLCEQRVIVTSSSISAISRCIYALRSLLYPFKWQYMFASILPGSLLCHLFTMMPFLVGITDNDMRIVTRLHLDPILVVHLDKNTLESFGEVECFALPGMANKLRSKLGNVAPQGVIGDRLKKGLNNILGKSLDMDQIISSDAIYALWMTFYVFTFGSWRRYVEVEASGLAVFSKTRFLDAARNSSEEEFIFLEKFSHTRMFETFTQEVIRHSQASLSGEANEFCRLCSIILRRDPVDQNLGFYNVFDVLKHEMYPSRSGRIAATALELTSSAPSMSDKASAFSILSQATFSSLGLREIFSVVKYRLDDCEGRSWRHASLTFEMLQTLLSSGSDAVLTTLRDNISQLLQFSNYTHKEEDTQILVRNQAEAIIRCILDLPEQAKRKSKNYFSLPDSILSFKVRASSVKSVSPQDTSRKIPDFAASERSANPKAYFKEFHSSARKALIDNLNSSWDRYRDKSIVKGRSRIFPKFLKLHKKFALLESGAELSAASQFEDLLDLSSSSNTLDFMSVNSTLPSIQPNVTSSTPFDWFSTVSSSQTTSSHDFVLGLLSGPSSLNKDSDAMASSQPAHESKAFDPFEGLFK